jgi:hypothetical protein
MQFMLLIYLDQNKFSAFPQADHNELINAMLDYDDVLKTSGNYIIAEPLQPPSQALTVRNWDTLTTTPGPFMATPEHLSGFFLIQAEDIQTATALAAKMPLAKLGSIEVRPLDQLERRE